MVRAKFRVLEVTESLRGASMKARPVIAKGNGWPNGSEENRRFWEASPSGELVLHTSTMGDLPAKVGDYLYVDMMEDGGGVWKLYEVAQKETSLSVRLGLAWDCARPGMVSADLYVCIENQAAWEPFTGKAGTRWRVDFVRAEGEHEGCPYTG